MLNRIFGPDNQMKTLKTNIFALFVIAAMSMQLQAQVVHATEKVLLSCDRTLFLAGETIAFEAGVQASRHDALPRVLYVELLDASAKQLKGQKIRLDKLHAEGSLPIPADLVSGYYFLRAYTRWMRNSGPSTYAWKLLKIVNPRSSNVWEGTSDFTAKDVATTTGFNILLADSLFSPRSKVEFQMLTAQDLAGSIAGVSLSVVPEAALGTDFWQLDLPPAKADSFYFYPETRGISLSGTLTDSLGMAVGSEQVYLTVVDQDRNFMSRITDSKGRFHFVLPDADGSRELFVCAGHTLHGDRKLLIDNDFCKAPVQLPSYRFQLSPEEETLVLQMHNNKVLQQKFFPADSLKKVLPEQSFTPFYGTPTHVLKLDDYVQLPVLEEYFNELPSMVKVRKADGKRFFRVIGTNAAMAVFKPLVLVDLVAIDDPEKVLSMSPKQLDRIEVVNVPYTKGDITYGGIVSLITKKGDFGAIDLPSSGLFLTYGFYDTTAYNIAQQAAAVFMPDVRNTLGWWPATAADSGLSKKFSFYAGDTQTHYVVAAKAVLNDGTMLFAFKRFKVGK